MWICQTYDGRKTCHATESGAPAEATLIRGSSKFECVVYRANVEGETHG